MGGKRGDDATGTCGLTSLCSKRARVGQMQQQRIAIDSDLANELSCRQARVQQLLRESEVRHVPRVEQFWRSMAQFDIIPRKCSEWIIAAKVA
jgi:hypothetical protein